MTKIEYLNLRGVGNLGIVYEYYKEMFDNKKHNPFLSNSVN